MRSLQVGLYKRIGGRGEYEPAAINQVSGFTLSVAAVRALPVALRQPQAALADRPNRRAAVAPQLQRLAADDLHTRLVHLARRKFMRR